MPLARLHLREATAWWAANRPLAPTALAESVRKALQDVARSPGIGRIAPDTRRTDVQRLHVRRVNYYLYYRVTRDRIEVLAFWHASRGTPPPLDN